MKFCYLYISLHIILSNKLICILKLLVTKIQIENRQCDGEYNIMVIVIINGVHYGPLWPKVSKGISTMLRTIFGVCCELYTKNHLFASFRICKQHS